MSDRTTMARAARQKLARALATLQHPGIPADLFFVAEPVAEAMTRLHELEVAGDDVRRELAAEALLAVRRALSGLQAQSARHHAIAECVEGVAGALNLTHVLTTLPTTVRPSAPPPSAPPSEPPVFADYRVPSDVDPPVPARVPRPESVPSGSRVRREVDGPPRYSRPSLETRSVVDPLLARSAQAGARTHVTGSPLASARPVAASRPAFPHAALDAASTEVRPAFAGPVARGTDAAPPSASARKRFGLAETEEADQNEGSYRPPGTPPPPAGGDLTRFEAEMTAHSPTNFYKGLAGKNVIDSGGVFVATYRLPKVGDHVLIDFSLPGGYQFQAKGIVSWTRETKSEEGPPGFGARFTELPIAGVSLVTRYVKNRDPLLFDDP